MNDFETFLIESRSRALQWKTMDEIHIVMGNEAGDLDSVMSTLGYAHFLYSTISKNTDQQIAVLPVLNFDMRYLKTRKEHLFLFEQAKVNAEEFLIYRDQLNFEEIVSEFTNSGKTLCTYLVDHHKLTKKDEVLKETVCRIFDHRPLDKYYDWNDYNLKMRIENVFCCCTLIADEIFRDKTYKLSKVVAFLMYCTIVYDMRGRSCPGTLDEMMKEKLSAIANYELPPIEIYKKLSSLHCKVDDLEPYEVLMRDLKFENGILFPRLDTLAEDFIKLPNAYRDIMKLCEDYQSDLAVLVCTKRDSWTHNVDLGMFFVKFDSVYAAKFLEKLREAQFNYVKDYRQNFVVLKYLGKKIGRKKVLPLILEIYEGLKNTS